MVQDGQADGGSLHKPNEWIGPNPLTALVINQGYKYNLTESVEA